MEDIFTCPISHEVMVDPVIAADGHSYERSEIEKWLLTSNLSPMTNKELASKVLTPNHTLRQAIQAANESKSETTGASTTQASSRTQAKSNLDAAGPPKDNTMGVQITPLKNAVLVSLCLPVSATTKPVCITAVLDISGSMGLPSAESTDASMELASRLSRLDLVKHSINTAIGLMRPTDCLAVITFGDNAQVLLEYTMMDDTGKLRAQQKINSMVPSGSTNLWGGISLAIEYSARAPSIRNAHKAIMLLTDGEPTAALNPPRGISSTLERTLASMAQDSFTIHCFGYGYGKTLDTPLLRDIATQGHGCFNYVPDGSMVGTVFIHFFCNLLAVALTHVSLEVKTIDPQITLADSIIPVGFMRPGQTRDLYIPYTGRPSKGHPIELVQVLNASPYKVNVTYGMPLSEKHFQALRHEFIVAIDEAIQFAQRGDASKASDVIKQLDAALSPFSKDHNVKKMREDLISDRPEKGQIIKSLDFWSKWGQHYLPSVWFAHSRQEKMNFKDASMEMYSTLALEAMIDEAERIFLRIPPPVPSIKTRSGSSYMGMTVDMSHMLNRSGGCFTATSLVSLQDGSCVQVANIIQGMRLSGGGIVRCVVRFAVPSHRAVIYRSSGKSLGITAWHPVRFHADGSWVFPIDSDYFTGRLEMCDAVYNIVLERGCGHVEIDGIACATLGHEMRGAVIEHSYFGTDKVIRDLQAMKGFNYGFVEFMNSEFVRDLETGLIHQIRESYLGQSVSASTHSRAAL